MAELKCAWYAEYEGVCTNADCPYCADCCPVDGKLEICRYDKEPNDTKIRYKDFEIRKRNNGKYEIVKWSKERYNGKRFCWVIAFLNWNDKEPCWVLDGVGTRFIDDYENGLCEFIREFLDGRNGGADNAVD